MHTSSHWRVLARRLGPRLGPLFWQTVWTRSPRRTLIRIHMLGAGMADYAPLHATTLDDQRPDQDFSSAQCDVRHESEGHKRLPA
jgi:hypothetical protein